MKRKEKFYTDEQKEIFKFVKILTILVVLIVLLYLFTVYVVNKEGKYKRTNNEGSINYDVALIGGLLNKADEQYYVLIFDNSNSLNSIYINKISEYKSKTNHLPVYTADLSNELNKPYISTESSHKNDSLDDFKVKGTTLIKVKSKKIVSFIENKNEILDELN